MWEASDFEESDAETASARSQARKTTRKKLSPKKRRTLSLQGEQLRREASKPAESRKTSHKSANLTDEDRKVLEARINQLQADIEAGRWERQKDAEDAASREGRLKQEIQKLRQEQKMQPKKSPDLDSPRASEDGKEKVENDFAPESLRGSEAGESDEENRAVWPMSTKGKDCREAAQCFSVIDATERGLVGAVRHFLTFDPRWAEASARFGPKCEPLRHKKKFKDIKPSGSGLDHSASAPLVGPASNALRKPKDLRQTPLHEASRNCRRDVVDLLLQYDAPLEARRADDGQTALHRAALNGHLDIVASLLRHKANVEALDVHRHSALHDAARYGYPAVVQLLLEHKANVEAKDVDGNTPLHRAAVGGNCAVVELLLKHGAAKEERNDLGDTALHHAAGKGRHLVVELLLRRRADVQQDDDGRTALHLAAANGHCAVAELLLRNGANIEEKDTNRGTPLHVAAGEGCRQVVELLLEQNADVQPKNSKGKAPAALADEGGHQDIAALLRLAAFERKKATGR